MIIDMLKEIDNGHRDCDSIAMVLNLSSETVKLKLLDLLRMGYIVTDAPACGDNACNNCAIRCNKSKAQKVNGLESGVVRWKMTRQGKDTLQAFLDHNK